VRIVIAIEKQNMGYQSEGMSVYAYIGTRIVAYSQWTYHIKVEFRLCEEFHVFEYNL